jgi:hypothetical protein
MSRSKTQDEENVILVEFTPAPGVRSVSFDTMDVIEKSTDAIDDAMKSIRIMSKKVVKTITSISISERPSVISVSFGIKLNAEGGAVISRASEEASINITMTWQDQPKAVVRA